MRFSVIIGILVLLATGFAGGVSPPKVHKDAGILAVGSHFSRAPIGWTSIPEPARSRIISHLKKRLGVKFFAKLSLVGGQIIDLRALREKEPDTRHYQWEIPAYRLHLRFSLPHLGVDYYEACIECRSDGSVISEIDLPEIARHPERAHFISTSQAFEIARRKEFDAAKAEVELGYRADSGVCVFTFMQETRRHGARIFFKCIDIDAHNGKVIKT